MDFVTVENGPVRHLKPAATYQESVGANWGNCLSKAPKPIVLPDQVSYGFEVGNRPGADTPAGL